MEGLVFLFEFLPSLVAIPIDNCGTSDGPAMGFAFAQPILRTGLSQRRYKTATDQQERSR
jgi:hypothetical protein